MKKSNYDTATEQHMISSPKKNTARRINCIINDCIIA